MATNIVDIDQIPPDIDEMAVGTVSNPLKEEFSHPYAGKVQTIPAATVKVRTVKVEKEVEETDKDGKTKVVKKKVEEEVEDIVPGKKQFPLYVAVHLAKHLAERIIREEFRNKIATITDVKEREIESAKPIPDYKGKIWEKMKELCATDSDFFVEPENPDDQNSNKNKFLK